MSLQLFKAPTSSLVSGSFKLIQNNFESVARHSECTSSSSSAKAPVSDKDFMAYLSKGSKIDGSVRRPLGGVDTAYLTWLNENMPESYKTELTDDEKDIVSHTLVYSERYEEYIHLNFKESALVIGLDRADIDEAIFKHYNSRGIREYRKYVSKAKLPNIGKPVCVARVGFTGINDPKASVPMPGQLQEELIKQAEQNDELQYKYLPKSATSTTLAFAWKNAPKYNFLNRISRLVSRSDLTLGDLRFAYLNKGTKGNVMIGTIDLSGKVVGNAERMDEFMREFELLKLFGLKEDALTPLYEKKRTFTGNQANLLRSLASILEQALTEVNPSMYTEASILESFCFHQELTLELLRVFDAKFHPKKHNLEEYEKLKAALIVKLKSLDTGLKKHDDRRRTVFLQALNIIDHILRTNYYSLHKLGIGFRINPAYIDKIPGFDRAKKYPELPFGMYFVSTGRYLGMHIRFRDLARGGMRTVITRDAEHESYERPNMYSECYNLAFTQQKKNKDIPEGGSKSIVFVSPNDDLAKELNIARKEMTAAGKSTDEIKVELEKLRKGLSLEYMYENQRCFLTTFLTLIVWDYKKNALKYGDTIVDYLKKPEYIYLGPDENFHDCLIDWLAAKSIAMGNFTKGAFISGKEGAGINHKHYGVTSWGVFQYLINALKFAKIDGPFTVKMTGGPDGDVAGNTMKLLAKYFPERAKLLTTTDGSGCGYDPEGFNWEGIMSLVNNGKMIASFPPELLHDGAWLLCMRRTRQSGPLSKEVLRISKKDGKIVEEWISSNQAFHIYGTNAHTTKADVFMPCGGRPRSLNINNVASFIGADGKLTSRVIVEGANLYITQDARDYLEDRGAILFRDSSANKCGVISSSYEILGGLSLDDDQFMKVKKELASDLLKHLEELAQAEAKCMLNYYKEMNGKVHLSHVSELVSSKINKFTDDLNAYLAKIDLNAPENKKLLDIFINYVPACIRRDYLDQCMKRVPDMHKKAIIATTIACHLVYKRGLSWWPSVPEILPTLL